MAASRGERRGGGGLEGGMLTWPSLGSTPRAPSIVQIVKKKNDHLTLQRLTRPKINIRESITYILFADRRRFFLLYSHNHCTGQRAFHPTRIFILIQDDERHTNAHSRAVPQRSEHDAPIPDEARDRLEAELRRRKRERPCSRRGRTWARRKGAMVSSVAPHRIADGAKKLRTVNERRHFFGVCGGVSRRNDWRCSIVSSGGFGRTTPSRDSSRSISLVAGSDDDQRWRTTLALVTGRKRTLGPSTRILFSAGRIFFRLTVTTVSVAGLM